MFEDEKLDIINIVTSIEKLKKSVEKLKRRNAYQNHNEVEHDFNPNVNGSMERIYNENQI